MREVKVTYTCDYCGEVIEEDDIVHILHTGRINAHDQVVHDPEDSIRHYHDYCCEHLLCLTAENEQKFNETKAEPESELEPEDEPTEEPVAEPAKPKKAKRDFTLYEPGTGPELAKKKKKDLPALKAFLDAGWTLKECAIEFSVAQSTIYKWKEEINTMIEENKWEDFCEKARKQ